MKYILLSFILFCFTILPATAQVRLEGRVLAAATRQPVTGATVTLGGTKIATVTGRDGRFSLEAGAGKHILHVRFIGFKPYSSEVTLPQKTEGLILLEEATNELSEVTVSTGYQELPAERAAGSFVKVDHNLLNRRVSPDIISRLEDLVPGLTINRIAASNPNNQTQISIRGQSTISGRPDPLIVVDHFPFDGSIDDINPNDVESITVLKDAAAASVWGAKAGNGVIVISTKKGRFNQKPQVSFNSNFTGGGRPDLYYQSRMSSSDFIEMEKYLFSKQYYKTAEASTSHAPLSPVVELLVAARDGKIAADEADRQIEAMKQLDLRNDLQKYFYRNSFNQQYQLSVSGGGEGQRYYISGGYDRNLANTRGNQFSRLSFTASNTYRLLSGRLQLSPSVFFTQTKEGQSTALNDVQSKPYTTSITYPYARLADENGNPLAVTRDFRQDFVGSAEEKGLLSWEYRPLDELALSDDHTKAGDYRINLGLRYTILKGLSADLLYQYRHELSEQRNLHSQESYYTRDMINKFTQVASGGTLTRPVPPGAITADNISRQNGQNLRLQLNYNYTLNGSELSGIAGYEIKDLGTLASYTLRYGYDQEHAKAAVVDYLSPYRLYYSTTGSTSYIRNADNETDLTDRFISYYANAAYALKKRYLLNGSVRLDRSNLFGVKTNQKGVPLWSAGLGWNLSNEAFYQVSFLPYLKMRATYGYNGNVNRSISAYVTARYDAGTSTDSKLPYATVVNPPNPELRWERVQVMNFGADFASAKNRVQGTLEYYRKKGTDLIGRIAVAPSTGISAYTGNFADIKGSGLEVSLHTQNTTGRLAWSSDFLFSTARDKVTSYGATSLTTQYLQSGYSGTAPLEGKPLYAIYSYAWAGLDPATGDPQGYLNSEVSKNYSQIIGTATPATLAYNGPSRPQVYGSLRNTLSWRNLSVSASISYRLHYFFRRESVRYANVLAALGGHGDYAKRWQQAGDEAFTSVPSMPAYGTSGITNRDNFYLYSAALVEKGDHIRLQDISINYALKKAALPKLPFNTVQLYGYINNLGILWRKNKAGLDPDYQTMLPVTTFAAGLKVDF